MDSNEMLIQLRQLLTQRFSDSELRTFCFDLGVPFEDLPGAGKADKARELVAYMERRVRLADLVRLGKRSRPDVPWPEINVPTTSPATLSARIAPDSKSLWSEKTVVATQRLAKDFGTVIQRFCQLPDSQEQAASNQESWHGWISVRETSRESEWAITLLGEETVNRRIYGMVSGKSPLHIQNYQLDILASLLVDDSIKLEMRGNVEHWSKLEGLWKKLWAELERQGYREAPALVVAPYAAKNQPATTTFHAVPWDVAVLPSGLAEVADFFTHRWDFAAPPFESKDGRQLKLDNTATASTDIHRVWGRDPEGRAIVTFNAMTQSPNGVDWDLGSAIPTVQFILESLGARTRVSVVLLERGAGPFLCGVLNNLISAYSQAERGIKQLIDFVTVYSSPDVNRASSESPTIAQQATATENGVLVTGNKSQATSLSALPAYKRKTLEQRLADLIEEHEAVSAQLRRTLSAADEVKLRRQQRHLEEQIAEVEAELGQAPAPLPSTQVSKAGPGSAPSPDQVYGAGNRWAVLVGVNAYEDAYHFGPLQVCVKDVEATRDQLIAGGFDPARIRLITDNTAEKPNRANILVALKAMADATEPGDLLLFYYSGHGDEAGGESYLVAREGRHLVLSDSAVPVMRIKQIMDAAPARAKVILLDACHSGANIGQKGPKPMTPEFIQRVFEQAEGMAILASCKQGQLSYEWRAQEQSAFTHYLLDALKGEADRDGKGFVTVQDASRHVTDGVKLWASQRNVSQTPTLEYRVAGDIVLTRYKDVGHEMNDGD